MRTGISLQSMAMVHPTINQINIGVYRPFAFFALFADWLQTLLPLGHLHGRTVCRKEQLSRHTGQREALISRHAGVLLAGIHLSGEYGLSGLMPI